MLEAARYCSLEVGTLDLDAGQIVRHDGAEVSLTALELKVLRHLADRMDNVVPLEELYRDVWGYSARVSSRAVDKTASRLRKKMERDSSKPVHLLRVPGRGLKLQVLEPEPEPDAPRRRPADPNLTGFYGREHTLETLFETLTERRVVTLVGPGGIGKSALLRELIRQANQPDAFVLVDASTTADLDELEASLARALDAGQSRHIPEVLQSRGVCHVVLDNVERIASPLSARVAKWLQSAPDATFIVTSQVPLRLSGEQLLRVDGLSRDAALAMFTAHATAVRPQFDASRHAAALDQLLEALDYSPLAIELAAARTGILSIPQLLDQLENQFRLLRTSHRDRPERQRSLHATLAWSWELLDASEQATLEAASVLVSDFDLTFAEAVLPTPDDAWTLDVIQGLVEKSMMHRDDVSGRFALGRAVRAYAAKRLEDTPEPAAVRQAVADACALHFSTKYASICFEASGHKNLTDLDEHARDLEHILLGARECTDLDAANDCRVIATSILHWQGSLERAAEVIRVMLQRCPLGTPWHAYNLTTAALFARLLGQHDEAIAFAERAVTVAVAEGQSLCHADALTIIANVRIEQSQFEESRSHLEAALAVFDRAPELRNRRGATLANLGFVALNLGEPERALAIYNEALQTFIEFGDTLGEGAVLDKLCSLYWTTGDLERARWYGERALRCHRRAGNKRFEAIALGNLGTLHQLDGAWDTAQTHYEDALALHAAQGNDVGQCITECYLGSLATDQRDWVTADDHFDCALRKAQALDSPPLRARVLTEWGAKALASREHSVAQSLLDRAAEEPVHLKGEGLLCALRGMLATRFGEHDKARIALERSREIGEQLGALPTSRLGLLIQRLEAALAAP